MAKNKQNPVSEMDVSELIAQGELTSELDLQRASLGAKILRLECEQNPKLEPLRDKLIAMMIAYESLHWSGNAPVSKSKMKETDLAEKQVIAERIFFSQRKEQILKRLKYYGLNQNDLAAILAHSKSYTSELLNGIRAFSMSDLIIIHRLFGIKLEHLIFTEISAETEIRIKQTIEKAAVNTSKSKNPSQVSSLVKALYSKNTFPPNEPVYEFPS
jgi:plasmid maintenance system antidote protein VapI